MTRTYKATGINLKGMPLGEADRLVTILTPEFGLIRAVAPGARKHQSRLRGRSELFVVNELLLAKGRSLDKITQAETIESYPGLSRDLGKLVASQYLAELVLCLAASEQAQPELYQLLNEHLRRIERLADSRQILPHLVQAVFHLLAIAGIGPQVHVCCLTRETLTANFINPQWRAGFSFEAGGLAIGPVMTENKLAQPKINARLGAVELTLLQHLGEKSLPKLSEILPGELTDLSVPVAWMRIERLLRDYVHYHFGRSLRSAALVEALSPVEF